MVRYVLLLFLFVSCGLQSQQNSDLQEPEKEQKQTIINPEGETLNSRINVPKGFERVVPEEGTFGEFLQKRSLLPHGSKVIYFNGENKHNQGIHVAIFDYDIGKRDLQQCSDAVIRLHAEYLYEKKAYSEIAYNFISDGKPRYFKNYTEDVSNYKEFRKYLDYIYSYSNTRSLYHQMNPVNNFEEIKIGDVFIQTGNPYGHAVIVVDMAENKQTGEKLYLLAQSYMPAQSIHIIINPNSVEHSPWYKLDKTKNEIHTPEWNFTQADLRRF